MRVIYVTTTLCATSPTRRDARPGAKSDQKDSHAVAGRTTALGMPAFAGMAAETETCPPASRLFEAGEIEIGRTRMPPGGPRWSTESEFVGVTRNPWDPTVTAGGSSGSHRH